MHVSHYTSQAQKDLAVKQLHAQELSAKQQAKEAELAHRAKPRNLDDDELRASCGAGPTNLGAPPRRR